MKVPHAEFEQLLRSRRMTKKAFSEYARIPYYTVAGWKKSGFVPGYAMVLLRQASAVKATVSAAEVVAAGLPRAIVWNSQSDKQVPVDIFIVTTLQKAYNDFVVDKLAEYFGKESVLAALLRYKDRISDRLAQRVTTHLQRVSLST